MVDERQLKSIWATIRQHSFAFFLALLIAFGATAAFYEKFRIPALDDRVKAAQERAALFKDRLELAKSASYSPNAGPNSAQVQLNCSWTQVSDGAFSSSGGDYKIAGWSRDDTDAVEVPVEDDPLTHHTKFARIVSKRILTGTNERWLYEKKVGKVTRNPQFPRIEFVAPKDWAGREVRMHASLRWEGVRLIPSGYPGVVAINVAYRDQADPNTDQYIVLHGEHFPDQAWVTYTLPTFKLPPGTTRALMRIGLHGVFGTLDVDDVHFEVCK